MMWNRFLVISLCIMAILITDIDLVLSEDDNATLIIYDRATNFGYTEDVLISVKLLLYHYTSNIDVINIDDIDIDLSDYDNIVVLGISEDGDFGKVGELISVFNGKVFWIGRGISALLKSSDKYGFTVGEDDYSFREVKYKDYRGNLGVKRGFPIIDVKTKKTKIIATINNSTKENPLIVKDENIWYLSRLDISGDNGNIFFLFADLLYDFYDTQSFEEDKIYIRLEDVHPLADIQVLRDIGEYLFDKEIPFMIALIPIYVGSDGSTVSMSDVPEFVETIQYMQQLGGSIVLHGYTHQYIEYTSGEGFEFWDGENNRPLNIDITKWVDDRLTLALEECVKNRIFPLIFEVPHYAISQEGYKSVAKYFSSIIGHLQNTDRSYSTTIYPFVIENTDYGFDIIPENIGYYDPNNAFNLDNIKDNIDRLGVVRGNLGGFFYHPYLGLEGLMEVVELIESYNYKYFDLKTKDFTVKWSNNYIELKDGKYYISYVVEDEEIDYFYWFGDSISILILFLGCIILIQIVIYLRFRKKHRKRIDK